MKLIFVASPLSGDMENNIKYAERACRFVMDAGHAFFAPHLLYTRILDDTCPEERRMGIDMGYQLYGGCAGLTILRQTI